MMSSVSCIKYLLEKGFHYVLMDKFSSDDIEGFFSNLRQMGGANNAMNCRSCLHVIETTLKTSIICASIHGNTESTIKENLIQIPSLVNVTSHVQADHHEFPADVMQILS